MSQHPTERVDRSSADIIAERIEELRSIFPEVVTEGKVDFEKLKAALGGHVDERPERYEFTWAGKQDAIKLLQKKTRATLVPSKKESVDFDATDNLFIEGENLDVLKLLYRSYFHRVKMIYIDPPYNTGEDLIYDDDFRESLEDYQKRTSKSATDRLFKSNTDTSGRYHSDWLSMMYPRLFLSRQLLKDDGLIFVSIDDAEVAHLRLVMNEIFGEENFLACFVWKRRSGAMDAVDNVSTDHEYVLCYSRNPTALTGEARTFDRYSNPDNDPRGPWVGDNLSAAKAGGDTYYPIEDPETGYEYWPPKGRYWPYNPEKMQQKIAEGRIIFPGTEDGSPLLKRFKREARSLFQPVSTWIAKPGASEENSGVRQMESSINTQGTREIKALFGDKVFSYPKPVSLIKSLIDQGTSGEDDIILDFFAGSCTTAHAVMELNQEDSGSRRFIMVQYPEEPSEKSPAAKTNFETIADLGKERIRRAADSFRLGSEKQPTLLDQERGQDLGFRVLKMRNSLFKEWPDISQDAGADAYAAEMEAMYDTLEEDANEEDVLYELALREGFSPLLEISPAATSGDATVKKVTDKESQRWMYVCLHDSLTLADLEALELSSHDVFCCRELALDDTAIANLTLRCTLKTF